MNALDRSKHRVLETTADGGIVLAHATAARVVAVHALTPAPRDPVRHLEEAHAQARTHLARLTDHDPSREILSFNTKEMFSRLTDPQPRPLTAVGVGRYTYTPRKALRRVLDHALDHLNQIDQWLAWQQHGTSPIPTDGWVGSSVTLPGDLLPLSSSDLDAWLWRVDQAARVVRQRAGQLTEAELDWLPPDGGWPLRRVLHHLARSERLYAASIDEALPGDVPADRYEEACRRLDEILQTTAARGEDTSIVFAGLYGVLQSREEVVELVLVMENELLTSRRL